MFDWVKSLIGRIRNKLIPSGKIEQAFSTEPTASREMEQNINLWYAMYINHPPWETCDVQSLGLPGAIGRELARHAMTEFDVTVSGGQRGDFLNEQIQSAKKEFKKSLELGLCLGGIALKPYIEGNKILVDAAIPTAFSPTDFDGQGRAIGGVFKEVTKQGHEYYARLEYHNFEKRDDNSFVYVIRNKAFKSGSDGSVGSEVSLSDVKKWADISPETTIADLEKPLFAYFKPPVGNDIEPESRVGVSIYGGATAKLIQQADEQWERIWWEYDSGERKIFADGTEASARQFSHRLFEFGPFSSDGDFFEQFSPEFRDEPLYRGFQRIIQRIEFNVGLAYGTISDPQTVEKTATEIMSAKQRQYATEGDIQQAFQGTIDDLLYAMNAYCDLYGIAPSGQYEASYTWGDGVLDDPDTRRQDRLVALQEVNAGVLKAEKYLMDWYGVDEETARSMIPDMEELTTEQQYEVE